MYKKYTKKSPKKSKQGEGARARANCFFVEIFSYIFSMVRVPLRLLVKLGLALEKEDETFF